MITMHDYGGDDLFQEVKPRPRWRFNNNRTKWANLPRGVIQTIFNKLGAIEVLTNASRVCRSWRKISMEPSTWHTVDMRPFGHPKFMDYQLDRLCRRAICRSRGKLVDITIEYFASDELLSYIARFGGSLRRLRLVRCHHKISVKGLCEMLKKLPLLEELDITYCRGLSFLALQDITRHTPLLKSLKFNQQDCIYSINVGHLSAIAESLPKLSYLQLTKSPLDKLSFRAILDRCPHLETLDLRQCYGLDIEEMIQETCDKQVKVNLIYPFELIDYYYDDQFRSYTCHEDVIWDHKHGYNHVVQGWLQNQARIRREEKIALYYEEDDGDWEEIDAIWFLAKSQRLRTRENNRKHKAKRFRKKKFLR
ncbi:hypothetical protein PIB30_075537 [Stylosanthes scabra]|uniref:F-box domain-containing protein n=1 Tax=Stylosanthes scabra TaxID=79078 RepID=A0ABU6VPH3_9FABA|nr:hypothetical protein [Stylosanthes scabra]